ncbi:MAG TPA: S26 family signal peptidase [Thermoplasmata archaeon]|nr:S26 family signal peptidase [Thermoplasmata archaeon]
MPRGSDDADEEFDGPSDDDPFAERPAAPTPRRPPRSRAGPLRGWTNDPPGDPDDVPEEWPSERPRRRRYGGDDDERPPVYWRARDSLYFEPLVALAIIVLLLVGLFAFSQTWPPLYVVESNSMQHAPHDVPGLINAGDLVMAQKIPNGSIQPYVVALRTGHATYGEYGDVLLYYPFGERNNTPLVHRALLWLQWNPTKRTYSAPDLNGLPCGADHTAGEFYYEVNGSTCTTSDIDTLQLYNVGFDQKTISLTLDPATQGNHSGFLTMGDNNSGPDQGPSSGLGSAPSLSTLVEPAWIIGVARGMLPWFGAIKLLFEGGTHAQLVPAGSWQYLGLSFIGVLLAAYAVHYALKREGVESPLRRREEEGADADDEFDAMIANRGNRGLKAWDATDEPAVADEPPSAPPRRAPPARPAPAPAPPRAPPRTADPRTPPPHRTPRRRRDADDEK